MINAQELRIGNLVNEVGTGPVKANHVDIMWAAKNPEKYNKEYKPIPLTPEILGKWCGFKRHEGPIEVYYLEEPDFELLKNRAGNFYACKTGMESVEHIYGGAIPHLHQLQNLFFALTGTELSINPQSK